MIGWTAVIFAIQGWLGETPAQAAAATTPSYLQVGMAAMSLGVVRISRFRRQLVYESNVFARTLFTTWGCHADFTSSGLHAPFPASYHGRCVVNWPCASYRRVECCLFYHKCQNFHFRTTYYLTGVGGLYSDSYKFQALYIC